MEDSIHIQNAGLVILAPFLPRYFDMLGMLENGVFKNPETAARGAMLLQYLASGETEAPEYLLAFNKVLCNLDIGYPIARTIVVTDHEEEASQQLLFAVLQNWEKMRSSTVENLRGSFILREGIIYQEDGHYVLKVEGKGYDILLSFLPWTISDIALPWMDYRLETVWTSNV